jgi:hypothetical protein
MDIILHRLKALYGRCVGARRAPAVSDDARQALIELNMLELNRVEATAWLHLAQIDSPVAATLQQFISAAERCLQQQSSPGKARDGWHAIYRITHRLNASFEDIKASHPTAFGPSVR